MLDVSEQLIATVSQVNAYVKALISQDEALHYLMVRGEISNFKAGSNGHLYFSLKDEKSTISVVMFNSYAKNLTFTPKNGDEVTIIASLEVYEARGSYQLYAKNMEMRGQGALLVELEELKKKLKAEGLFDEPKRPVTLYPKAIGVITAPNGAAIRDIVTNIKRRYPIADIYVFPSAVQGADAPKELIRAFDKSQEYDLDTLIIGRGGGSVEDLSAFNDEALVRAVATSKMPVISAVGHEVDMTLLDYVADVRASTPTGAAEKATVDRREIEQDIDDCISRMKEGILAKLNDMKESVQDCKDSLYEDMIDKIKNLELQVSGKKNQLEALNPKNVLKRGYSISLDKNGNTIKSTKDISLGDEIKTLVSDGAITSTVNGKE